MNNEITIIYGPDEITVTRDQYPDAASILESAVLRSSLRFPENSNVKDESGNLITGAIPDHLDTVVIDRVQGDKN